ncbi:MAG TPA: septation protein IspZ [Caulobacteraceae bacterium]|jgi:intracellular septation protein A
MKSLLQSAKFLALDMASTIFFLIVYSTTKSIPLSVVLGVALGFAQIGWEIVRKRPIETMQWMSLFLVVAGGTAALLTNDARFITIKASVIYVIIGVVMLKPGWMNRYLPATAIEIVPDIAFIFGFVWSGLMFLSAVVNLVVAFSTSFLVWTAFMSAYALSTKIALFLIQYATMRFIAVRRRRALPEALPAAA